MPGEDFLSWSTTAIDNGTADSSINWAEGQARASVNNSSRSMMAALAKHRNLNNGSITTGGTANAQTFTSGVSYTAVPAGLRALLKVGPGLTNTGPATLSMDSIGAVAVKDGFGADLGGGEFPAGAYVELLYNGTNWIVQNETGGLVPLSSATASASATLDFTAAIDGAYGSYLITLANVVPDTDGAELQIQVSEDAGASWQADALDYNYAAFATDSTPANASSGGSPLLLTSIPLASDLSSTAANPLNGTLLMFLPSSTTTKKMFQWDLSHLSASGLLVRIVGTGCYDGTAAINGLRFLMSSGNLATGTIKLFGIR